MHVICHGCGFAFKHSGLAHNLRQSKNPQCQMPNHRRQSDHDPGAQDTLDNLPVTGPPAMDTHALQEQFQLDIDPAGDIFGDYTNYGAGDFGMEDREDRDIDEPATGEGHLDSIAEMEEEDKIALSEAILAEDEQRLEPERPL